ncbi:carbonic anhydrase/acetyltransferase-like protein (isoleucine patch superfamily) [Pseudoxanthomonas winnipegensis]|nr:carbonic anhydrase/acetyltransferase-like protein (isoleucine patch superfamily) [Pseudoxanthomonas winnipegensis]
MSNLRPFLDKRPVLGQRVYVDPACTVIGDVELGDDVSVWPGTVIRGDVNHVRIGARTNVQDGTIVHVSHHSPYNKGGYPTLIGEDVTVGHGTIIHACTIGDACLIGMGACVLDGAIVEHHAFIGAGAVVGPGKRGGQRRTVGRQSGAPGAAAVGQGHRRPAVFGPALRTAEGPVPGSGQRLTGLSANRASGDTRRPGHGDAHMDEGERRCGRRFAA